MHIHVLCLICSRSAASKDKKKDKKIKVIAPQLEESENQVKKKGRERIKRQYRLMNWKSPITRKKENTA